MRQNLCLGALILLLAGSFPGDGNAGSSDTSGYQKPKGHSPWKWLSEDEWHSCSISRAPDGAPLAARLRRFAKRGEGWFVAELPDQGYVLCVARTHLIKIGKKEPDNVSLTRDLQEIVIHVDKDYYARIRAQDLYRDEMRSVENRHPLPQAWFYVNLSPSGEARSPISVLLEPREGLAGRALVSALNALKDERLLSEESPFYKHQAVRDNAGAWLNNQIFKDDKSPALVKVYLTDKNSAKIHTRDATISTDYLLSYVD